MGYCLGHLGLKRVRGSLTVEQLQNRLTGSQGELGCLSIASHPSLAAGHSGGINSLTLDSAPPEKASMARELPKQERHRNL